jgi:hypothetical protein
MGQAAERVGLPVVNLGLDVNLIASGLVGDLFRSDHGSFWLVRYPAIMITDTPEFRNTSYENRSGNNFRELRFGHNRRLALIALDFHDFLR